MIDLAEIEKLNGKSVLVKSTRDSRVPPTAMRGSLRVEHTPGARGSTAVNVVLDYPDMFTAPAHQYIIPLDVTEVSRLLSGGMENPLEIMLAIDLEQEARDKTLVAPRALQPR
jgi:hypothetical protein